jgi:4-hydroxy-tetrahydrodipicolinate synthase
LQKVSLDKFISREKNVTTNLAKGLIADIVTPLTAGEEVDLDALRHEVKLLEASAVNGLCIGGVLSGLEGALPAELSAVTSTVRKASKKPLFAVILPDTTIEALEMTSAVVDAGADAVLMAQPHYLSLPSEEGLVEMFADVKKKTKTPVLLADCFPNGMVGLATTKSLVSKGLVDGVWQAADVHVLIDLLYSQLGVPVYSGIEDLHLVAYVLGAQGVISNLATAFPKEASEVYRAIAAGKYSDATPVHERLVRLWRALGHGPHTEGRVRAALEAQGRKVGPAPSPFNKIPAGAAGEVRSAMEHEGLRLA